MGKLIGRLSLVSSLTLLSRILGLGRDVLFFSCFGASLIGEAFILAFTFPNLFRRMLGEGTLSSAFIPVFTDTLKVKSKEKALFLLNQVASRLFVFLGLVSLVVCVVSYYVSGSAFLNQAKWVEGLFLNSISFGYVVLICGSAILVGALNSTGRFFEGAFSPVILNLFMIISMMAGKFIFGLELRELAMALCVSVLLAGVVQLLLPWLKLRSSLTWKFRLTLSTSAEMEQIKSLFWVGALGAAVGQINILVSRFFAYSLDESGGLSYLFLSSRLVELPLGVFAIAITTVFFPEMARAVSGNDQKNFLESVHRGLRLTAGITIPAAVGLAILAEPILTTLFQWGEFGREAVMDASEILLVASVGLPFYAISTFLVKVYHSKKKMNLPLQAAVISLSANLFFSVFLIGEYQVHGLAWANVLAAMMQTLYLVFRLEEISFKTLLAKQPLHLFSILLSAACMALVIWFLQHNLFIPSNKIENLLYLFLTIPAGVITYGIVLVVFRFPESNKIVQKIISR
jgi:putative peptidoglycan lipid II flippase